MQSDYILDKIRYLRDARKWSEYKLSEESGIPQSTISSWFLHKAVPSIASLDAICRAFNISLSQFFCEDETCTSLNENQKELLILSQKLTKRQFDHLLGFLSEI